MRGSAGFEAAVGDECAKGLNDVPMDGAFEFAGSVLSAGSLVEEELPGARRDIEAEAERVNKSETQFGIV